MSRELLRSHCKSLYLALVLCFWLAPQSLLADDCLTNSHDSTRDGLQTLIQIVERLKCPRCSEIKSSCSLKTLQPIPKLILVGERHGDLTSEKVNRLIYQNASSQLFPLLSEPGPFGAHLPWGFSNGSRLNLKEMQAEIEGIESPIPYAILLSYEIQRAIIFDRSRERLTQILKEFVKNIEVQPLFNEAYAQLSKKEKQFKKYLEVIEPLKNTQLTDQDFMMGQRLIHALHKELIDIAIEKYSERLNVSNLPYFLSAADRDVVQIQIESLLKDVRERDFVEKISEALCRYSKKSTAIVLLVGQGHREGIEAFLDGLSGGRVQSSFYQSSDPKQYSPLIQAIGGIQFKSK